MKRIICYLSTLLAAILFVSTAGAQVSTYERTPGYYTFGINGGLSYQQADIPTTLEGYGLGLTLAKNLYYQPGSIFAFDLRGRLMYAQSKGLDYNRSYGILDNEALNGTFDLDYTRDGNGPGFVFQNNKTDQVELGLEGVIHFNKLREKTNVNLSLFGGIGIDWYNVTTDQSGRGGLYTDGYLGIDTLSSVSFIKDQLKTAVLDGRYETEANGFDGGVGKIGFMPSLGVELGYQFTPRFSMGVGHKVTFTKSDLFDGHQWRNNNNLTSEDDIHHYTNLHLRWIIDDNSKKLQEPLVDITTPALSPHTTRSPTFDVRATVKHISSAMDINFTVNGRRETFNFRKKDFKSIIRLQPGNNEVVITATNNAGSDSDVVNIFYETPVIDGGSDYAYPTVDITNPTSDNFRTNQERFNVRAQLRNVNSKQDIEVSVNGRTMSYFEFSRGSLSADVDLVEGRNVVRIAARNSDGFASDETTIIYEEERYQNPPSVNITNPSANPYNTNERNVTVEATVYNVQNKQDIRYTVNGYESSDFDFNNGVLRANVNINTERTTVAITATNEGGQASDSVVILWEEEEQTDDRPVVTITSTSTPTVDPFNPNNCKSTVIATILNINDRNDISVWVNGTPYTNYGFNINTRVFQTTIQLNEGTTEVRIQASNASGTGEDIARIEGCQPQQKELPEVTITSPSNNKQSANDNVTVKATVLNVSEKNDITFELNGRRTSNFSYDKFTNVFSASVTLEKGNNSIFVEATNQDGIDSDRINVSYQAIEMSRPPVVTIDRPSNNSTTNEAAVTLTATAKQVTSKSDIEVFLNGKTIQNFSFDERSKAIRANLNLDKGNNTIRVIGSNNSGTDEASVNVRFDAPKPKLPVVDITAPSNGPVSTNTVTLVAKIQNVSNRNDITVSLNGKTVRNFEYNNNTVKASINLETGNNTMTVKASNNDGSDQDQVTVVYEAPRPKLPTVTINTPKNNTTTKNSSIDISATVLHVISKRSISVKVNGKDVSNFNFRRGLVTANAKLSPGKNTITVKAANNEGSDEDQVIINYRRIMTPPVVTITSPKNNQKFEQSKVKLTASIKNVTNKRDISLILNGKSYSFNYKRGGLSADLVLKKGTNNIAIKANNSDGQDQAAIKLMYTPKLVAASKPTVSFSTPAKPGAIVKKSKYTIRAIVKHVKDKKDITLTMNGQAISKFNFSTRTGELKVNVSLKAGKNDLLIKVENFVGKDSDVSSVVYQKIAIKTYPPKVNIISVSTPTVDPFNPDEAKSTVIAKLENVRSKNDITFTFNGKVVKDYSFSNRTGALQITLKLKRGNNTVVIKAKNKDGQDQASRNIQFGDSGTGSINSRKGKSTNTNSNGRKSRKG